MRPSGSSPSAAGAGFLTPSVYGMVSSNFDDFAGVPASCGTTRSESALSLPFCLLEALSLGLSGRSVGFYATISVSSQRRVGNTYFQSDGALGLFFRGTIGVLLVSAHLAIPTLLDALLLVVWQGSWLFWRIRPLSRLFSRLELIGLFLEALLRDAALGARRALLRYYPI